MRRLASLVLIAVFFALAGTTAPRVAGSQEVVLTIESYRYWAADSKHHVAGIIRNTTSFRVNGVIAVYAAPGLNNSSVSWSFPLPIKNLAPGERTGFYGESAYSPAGGTPHLLSLGNYAGTVDYAPVGAVAVRQTGPIGNTDVGVSVPVRIENTTPWRVLIRSIAATFVSGGGVVELATETTAMQFVEPGSYLNWEANAITPASIAAIGFLSINGEPEFGNPYTVVSWTNWFHDVGSSAFKTEVAWLREKEVTTGCQTFFYCPMQSVTRAQMASFLARALDLPATANDYFSDDEGLAAENDINRLAAAGITSGCAAGLYCPSGLVTREQMASFLARAFDLPATATDYFTDDETSTHEANINRLAASGITAGCSATKYCPKANVSREQMAAFLYRALN
jgi:hypothetical protein